MGANSAVLVTKFEQLGGVQQQLLRVRRVCVFLCTNWGRWMCEMMKKKEWMTAVSYAHHKLTLLTLGREHHGGRRHGRSHLPGDV